MTKDLHLVIKDTSDNIIYTEIFTIEDSYVVKCNMLNFGEIKLEIYSDEEKIHAEEFRFRNKYDFIKMPVIRVANTMGVGDLMMMTPLMKKLHSIFKQRVTICIPFMHSEHNKLTVEYFKEFIYKNPDFNFLSFWTYENPAFDDPQHKYEIYNIFDADWNAYYYMDLKQQCASKCGITLKDEELDTIYIADEYKEIENLPKNYVCINPAIRGPERAWEKEKWQQLVNILNDAGIPVVSIGRDSGEETKHYYNIDIKLGLDLAGNPCQNNLSQTWHLINKSSVFVSFDTGTYLFAGSTDAHIIFLGWCSDPWYHQPYRKGSKYYKFSTVRGNCKEYCLSDPKWDVLEHNSLKIRHIAPYCELNINFACKPSVEQVVKEITKIFEENKLYLTN
jgi:ADP-heptose:LPS heptosyltransferase